MGTSLTRRRFRPSTLRHLCRSTRGVTALEFAFVAPVMLLMIMGIVEFALIMFTMATMEAATASTARMGKTGYTAVGLSREQTILKAVQDSTAGLLDPNKIVITYKIYPSFQNVNDPEPFTDSNGNGSYNGGEPYTDINGNGQWDQDMGASGLGSAGDVVVYNITYPWPVKTPIISVFTGNPFNVTVRTVVKNEPFDG